MLEGQNFEIPGVSSKRPLLSIVVPVLNEQDAIVPFITAIDSELSAERHGRDRIMSLDIEIIFVDDGSVDETSDIVRKIHAFDRRVKLVRLSRNFGKEAALSAGLKAAAGDAVVPMDVDLQDPPELLRPMIERWRNGAKVVNARRIDRSSDTFFKRNSSRAFYRIINSLSDHPISRDVGDFRLLDRMAVNALNQLEEHSRFNKGLFAWIGFPTETIDYVRPERSVGDTKWNASKLVGLGIDGVVSSTTLPLRIWTLVGVVVATAALVYAGFLVIDTLVWGRDTPGYASLMVAILFLGGLNFLSLGLLGEYIGRIATQVRGRPLYIVCETEGI